jgi:hypothetical protein
MSIHCRNELRGNRQLAGRHRTVSPLAVQNAELARENERLKQHCADLVASAELWIRLYEAALHRSAHGSSAGPSFRARRV